MHENSWRDDLHKKPKLTLYQKLKISYFPEKYVTQNLRPNLRSCIAQFRLGVLPLHVETGRFSGKPKDQRVCTMCNSYLVEDELHFLFVCEKYNGFKYTLYQKITQFHTEFAGINLYEKLQLLSEHPKISGNFIQKAFSKHQALLY